MNSTLEMRSFNFESDADDENNAPLSVGSDAKNYITRQGYERLRAEWLDLIDNERPKVVEVVHWAASNGDRSENGDYLSGKKRLREIDRRIRFLTHRLEIAEIVDSSIHAGSDQIFFGADVTYARESGDLVRVRILGVDEANSSLSEITWVSPVARALLGKRLGDEVLIRTPSGSEFVAVVAIQYLGY